MVLKDFPCKTGDIGLKAHESSSVHLCSVMDLAIPKVLPMSGFFCSESHDCYILLWSLEPEFSNVEYMDPVGTVMMRKDHWGTIDLR